MPDKDRLSTLDVKLAYEEWRATQDDHEANLAREGEANREPYIHAHQINRYETMRRAFEKAQIASAPLADPDPSTPTPSRLAR